MGSSSAAAAALLPATALPNMYQGVQKESAGYKLLASMGWREGDGLVSGAGWEEGGKKVHHHVGLRLSSRRRAHSLPPPPTAFARISGGQEAGHQGARQGQEEV